MKLSLNLILPLILFSSTIYADAFKSEVSSFLELEKLVNDANKPTSTLIVMDDDDTLTMMECDKSKGDQFCQYLGGPAWYAWQSDLLTEYLSHEKDSPYRVASTESQLLDITTLLFSMNNMPYTDTNIPKVLTNLSKKGVRLMVETARGNSTVAPTVNQFNNLKSVNGNFMELIKNSALLFAPNNSSSLASPFSACNIPNSRDITYQNGVMYLSGQNKGVMLKCMLTHYENSTVASGGGFPIDEIFFIDDTLENVVDIYETFKDNSRYKVHALHYTALQKHKAELTKGAKKDIYQKQAHTRWLAIKNVMQSTLLQPNIGKK